jgi:CRP/FNR family transcriptional regulator, anaerobic regulatory protein
MLPLSEGEARTRFLAVFGKLFPKDELPPTRLEPILASLLHREMEEGTTILREGQVCASIPFVLSGSIRVFKTAESGREISLYRVERGQSCILSLGCGTGIASFPASVVVEKAAEAVFLPRDSVHRLFAEGRTFRDWVLDEYSRRMAEVMELVEEIAFRKVDERLAQWLAELGSASPSGLIAATHQELADHVGTSREVVSRILKDWEQRGALEISRGSLMLLAGFDRLQEGFGRP